LIGSIGDWLIPLHDGITLHPSRVFTLLSVVSPHICLTTLLSVVVEIFIGYSSPLAIRTFQGSGLLCLSLVEVVEGKAAAS
jgi:hypothetical protein